MSPARSRFVGNTVALAASTVLATGLTLAQMKLLAGNLTLATFGLFASLRGLSLLISMLASNGLPQVLVRFIPEHAARAHRSAARRLSLVAIFATLAACVVLLAVVALVPAAFLRDVDPADRGTGLMLWFALTTLAVALKLVLYGGFNGLRRFGTQTVLETGALLLQVVWMFVERDSLTLTRLFQITGVTSMAAALVAIPWYFARLRRDVSVGDAGTPPFPGRYWLGATGLGVVAVAFTDVDRWVLSSVLALEALSLFHVASRVARLTNRFIAIPVLAFQPEVTRVSAEGRGGEVEASTRAFFKASVLLATFGAAAICVFADDLIRLASNDAFLGARTTLWWMAASIPLTAMTAPLTAVMKALDAVRDALYCDLVWAAVYVGCMLLLARWMGLEGAGIAQLAAAALQLVLAVRLARVRPTTPQMLATLARTVVCALLAFAPALVLRALDVPPVLVWAGGAAALVLYLALARRLRVLSPDERERVRARLGARLNTPALAWFIP